MPIEHEVLSGCPSTIIGEPMAAMVFSATCWAPSSWSSSRFSRITANSSPPSRATVSVARTHAVSRAATRFSSSSPTWWPSESLIVLKRSRSMNMNAKPTWFLAALKTHCSRRSWSSTRLGSPVSASRVARYSARSSARFLLVTSVEVPVMRSAFPDSSRWVTLPREWIQIHSPAALGTRYSQSNSSLTPFTALPRAAVNTGRSSGWVQPATSSPAKVDSRGAMPRSDAQLSLKYTLSLFRSQSHSASREPWSARSRRSLARAICCSVRLRSVMSRATPTM